MLTVVSVLRPVNYQQAYSIELSFKVISHAAVDVVLPHALSDHAIEGHTNHEDERDKQSQSDSAAVAAFQSIFDMAPVPMMITTGSGRIEYMKYDYYPLR